VIILSLGKDIPGTQPKGPPQVNPRRPPSGRRHLSTTQTLFRYLTRECYPVVSLLSSKIGGLEGFAPSRHLVSCPAKAICTGGTPTEWVFRFLKCFWNVLRNEGFYGGRSANPATNLLIKSNPTAGGHLQTQLGTRYVWMAVGSQGAPPPFDSSL